jgi:NAD(P)-dependent dehydrogenase (short-subunit alcohol dehydrogenase family)
MTGARHLLVTGGASGIGHAVARRALAAGLQVTVLDRQPAQLDGARSIQVDVTDGDALRAAVDAAIRDVGGLDALVCAAGVSGSSQGDGPVASASQEAFDTVIAVNLRGIFLTASAAWPALTAARGCIVTVSSVLGLTGGGGPFRSHAYIASKGGIVALTRALAAEGAHVGIRANCVAPALVRTPLAGRVADDPGLRRYVAARQPLIGGLMDADDIAGPIEFLYSDASRAVTGQVLAVDGGWTLEPATGLLEEQT